MKRETIVALLLVAVILLVFGYMDVKEIDHDNETAHIMLSD